MARAARIYPPDERRLFSNNLQCYSCGSTSAFSIDLRLRHKVEVTPAGIEIGLDKAKTDKVLQALQRNLYKVLDGGFYRDNPRIKCANCEEGETVDMVERILDVCWNQGCPGCWYCGNFLEKEVVIETCTDCILQNQGQVTEEFCLYSCPEYDEGLAQVREHHGLSLEGLRKQLGYPDPPAG